MSLPKEFDHEIVTFRTEVERQVFIADLTAKFPGVECAINIDPVESYPDRFLVAVRIPSN